MARRFPVYFLAPLALAAACAAPGGEPDRYWQKLAVEGNASDFDFDNARCGATASRMERPRGLARGEPLISARSG